MAQRKKTAKKAGLLTGLITNSNKKSLSAKQKLVFLSAVTLIIAGIIYSGTVLWRNLISNADIVLTKPDASNTGVSEGVVLEPVYGDTIISQPGLYEGKDYKGFVTVTASDVTIKNSIIRGGVLPPVVCDPEAPKQPNVAALTIDPVAKNVAILDSEVAIANPHQLMDGIKGSNFTVRRTEITKAVDGIDIMGEGNVLVRASFIHDLHWEQEYIYEDCSPTPSNAIQVRHGQNIEIVGNNLKAKPYNHENGDAAIRVYERRGKVTTALSIRRNWSDFGTCTFKIQREDLGAITNLQIIDNKFGQNQSRIHHGEKCAMYMDTETKEHAANVISGNVWTNGSLPVPTIRHNGNSSEQDVENEENVPDDPTDGPPTNHPSTPTGRTRDINVVSYNYAHWKPISGMTDDMRRLSETAHVIGLQEFGPSEKREALRRLVRNCERCGFGMYMPDHDHGGNIPIVWKKSKFKLVSKGNLKVYNAQRVEDGAGGPDVTAKHITWVRLKDRATGRVFFHMNNHLIPTVEANGHPNRNKPQRLALYDKHLTTLIRKARDLKQHGAPVFISGDFNVNHLRDREVRAAMFPYRSMGDANIWSNWRYLGNPDRGTLGNRVIDYVFVSRNQHGVPVDQRILPGYASDHRPVMVTIRLK